MSCQLINADCGKIFPNLADESVDLILTDPPYKDYVSNRRKLRLEKIMADGYEIDLFANQSLRVLKPGRHLYIFCDHLSMAFIREMLRKRGFICKDTLVWVKNNHGAGDLKGGWAPQVEFILFFTKGKGRALNRPRHPNVFFYPKVDPALYQHGTVKPVELLKVIIKRSSNEGELVLDPYAGTGSVGVAALEAGKEAVLIEKDEKTYQKAKMRLYRVGGNLSNTGCDRAEIQMVGCNPTAVPEMAPCR